MANKPRPKCTTCNSTMSPVFRKRPRGETMIRVSDTFVCPEEHAVTVGRNKTKTVKLSVK